MSAIPDEAVEKASEAMVVNICYRPYDYDGYADDAYYAHLARAALVAALPALMEWAAQEIEGEPWHKAHIPEESEAWYNQGQRTGRRVACIVVRALGGNHE